MAAPSIYEHNIHSLSICTYTDMSIQRSFTNHPPQKNCFPPLRKPAENPWNLTAEPVWDVAWISFQPTECAAENKGTLRQCVTFMARQPSPPKVPLPEIRI